MESSIPPLPVRRLHRHARRTIEEMREEMRGHGGHMLHYGLHPDASAAQRHAWELVESKGFLVLEGGCVCPHKYYRNKGLSGPARVRGPSAAVEALVSPLVDRQVDPGRDDRGWPQRLEISHLCHNPHCCAPGHLVVEERWRNWRRNYCSPLDAAAEDADACACGSKPKCIAMYHPSCWWDQRFEGGDPAATLGLITDQRLALTAVRGSCGDRRVEVRPWSGYIIADGKSMNKAKRRHAGMKSKAGRKKGKK